MMSLVRTFLKYLLPALCIGTGLGAFAGCEAVEAPAPYGVVPTAQQVEWQKMEYYMFAHFGPNTFTDKEWGSGQEDPNVFHPTALDCRQWAQVAKDAGMKGIILTAKHHDGFCLWPSKFSTHTVRESAWMDGQGDVVAALAAACREYDLKLGLYLSPWDRNHPAYGTPEYNSVFANTLEEILTGYGPIFEQWFDGAGGDDPRINAQRYDWELFNGTVQRHQSQAVIFSDVGPGCRWVGNERGVAGATNWARLDVEGYAPGRQAPPTRVLNQGQPQGSHWVPAEVDVSIRPGWFYSSATDSLVKPVEKLMDIYYTSVGRNGNLLLNVPPNRQGRISSIDSLRLMEFRDAREALFSKDLARGAKITASHSRPGGKRFAARNVLNAQYDTYWAPQDTVLEATLELTLAQDAPYNTLLLQEYIPLGQRIDTVKVEAFNAQTKEWELLVQATTVGYKRLLPLPETAAGRLRITFHGLACPLVNRVALYFDPMRRHGGLSS